MNKFKLLTQNSFDIISILADDGTIKFESNALENILGYKTNERVGESVFKYVHPDDLDYVIKEFSTRDKKVKRLEFRLAHKNGNWVWLEAVGQDFIDDPEVKGIIVNSRDITEQKKEQKKLAKSEKQHKRLINNSNSLIMEVDADSYEIISCNQAMAKSFNQTADDLKGKNLKDILPPEALKKRVEYGNKALRENKVQHFEDERNGRFFINNFIPYTDQGRRYIQTITHEITDRKKVEKDLIESETKYEELFHFLDEGFLRADKNGIITMANNSIVVLAGYKSPEELIGVSMNKLYAIPSDRNKMLHSLNKEGILRNYAIRLKTKDGDIRWASCNIKYLRNDNNEIIGTEGLVRDITEQKRLEQKYNESQQQFKEFMAHIPGAAFLKDKDNNLLYCNQKYASQMGTTPENLIKQNALQKIPDNLQRRYREENEAITSKGKLITAESEFPSKNGVTHWLTYKFPVAVQNETFVGAISIDITDRKQAEEALKKSEEKYRIITENASDVIWILNLNKKAFSYISPSVFALRGYTPEEAMEQDINQSLTPESAKKVTNTIEQILPQFLENPKEISKKTYRHELRQTCKDGSIIWIETTTKYQFNRNNEVEVLGISRNIDERKKAEQALKESEEKFKAIFDMSLSMICIADINTATFKVINPAFSHILGYTDEELLSKPFLDFVHHDDKESTIQIIEKALKAGKKVICFENRYRCKDGSYRWIEWNSHPITDKGITYAIGYDVTERKENEIAIKEINTKLTNQNIAFESSVDGIAILDEKLRFTYLNKAHAENYGYSSPDELVNKSWKVLYDKDEIKRIEDEVMPEFIKQGFWSGEAIGLKKQGTKFYQQISLTMLENGGVICIVRDTSMQKQIEIDLQESEERFRNIFNFSPSGISITNMDGEMSVNEAFCKILGYSADELKVNFTKITHPDDVGISVQKFEDLKKGKINHVQFEKRYIHKNGQIVWVDIVIASYKENEILKYFITSIVDITNRKKAERALIKSQDNLGYLNRSLSQIIGFDSLNKIYQYMADSVHSLYPNSLVLYISIDETQKNTVVETMAGLDKSYFEKMQKIAGFKLIGKHYKLQEKYKNIFNSGKLDLQNDGFTEFVSGTFPSLAAKSVQKVLSIDKIYTIGIKWENDLLGAMIIFTLDKTEIPEHGFIENYTAHMAAVIRNKMINDQLQKSEAQYRELNATKDKFFNIISHDLKGPFSSILGFSELVNNKIETKEYEKVNSYCDHINKSAKQSYDLLDNLLQWSRIQTRRIEFTPEKLQLKDIIDGTLTLLTVNSKVKDIEIDKHVSEELQVKADKFMLETIIRNLVSNAIKFTNSKGKISIRAKQESKETIIEVKDNGVGINKKDIKKLFKIESTYSTEGTNEEKGTGLGLIMCKEFVEMHGGRIWVESKEGEGSKFIFNLPQIAEH